MPFIAHNQNWILGVGETRAEAREHMLKHHADQTPTVVPATRALVDSILNDPFRQPDGRLLFEEIPASQSQVEGIACLAEEWQALEKGIEAHGFTTIGVRREIEELSASG